MLLSGAGAGSIPIIGHRLCPCGHEGIEADLTSAAELRETPVAHMEG
jgi:hypothetical protein